MCIRDSVWTAGLPPACSGESILIGKDQSWQIFGWIAFKQVQAHLRNVDSNALSERLALSLCQAENFVFL